MGGNVERDAMLYKIQMALLINLLVGNMDIETATMRCAEGDAKWCDADDARYSPMNGECSALCPLFMTVGTTEMLLDDTLRFAEKAHAAGVEVEVELAPFMCHVWPTLISLIPDEAAPTVGRAADFINRHLDASASASD